MIKRDLERIVLSNAKKFPIVAIVGPRQSGKTTLSKHAFPDYNYVSLEDPDKRRFAEEDPRGFLSTYSRKSVIDEIQRVPELIPYLQTKVDEVGRPGQYVITGSQHFLLMEKVSESLAGRVALTALLPLSFTELRNANILHKNYVDYLFMGGYPRVFDQGLKVSDWYPNYFQTYIERDVRNLKNITDLSTFQKFIKLTAGRVGQLINLSSLANDAGISHNTAKDWISVLEASFIIKLIQPYHKNFNKRLVKSPKLYFIDTGLAVWLLGIENQKQLTTHYLLGNLFENWVVSEYLKFRFNRGLILNCYFWRDKTGNEIDLLIETAGKVIPIEIKSGKTINPDYFKEINHWNLLQSRLKSTACLIYGGDENQKLKEAGIVSWSSIPSFFPKLLR